MFTYTYLKHLFVRTFETVAICEIGYPLKLRSFLEMKYITIQIHKKSSK